MKLSASVTHSGVTTQIKLGQQKWAQEGYLYITTVTIIIITNIASNDDGVKN